MRKLIAVAALCWSLPVFAASCLYVGANISAGPGSVMSPSGVYYLQGIYPYTSWTGGSDCTYGLVLSVAEWQEFTGHGARIAVLEGGGSTSAGHVLTDAEYAQFQSLVAGAGTEFDYALASAVFAFFFSFTVGVWFVSKNFGLVVEAVRRW